MLTHVNFPTFAMAGWSTNSLTHSLTHTDTELVITNWMSECVDLYSALLLRLYARGIVTASHLYCARYWWPGWLGSRVVSELVSGAEGPGFKSRSFEIDGGKKYVRIFLEQENFLGVSSECTTFTRSSCRFVSRVEPRVHVVRRWQKTRFVSFVSWPSGGGGTVSPCTLHGYTV